MKPRLWFYKGLWHCASLHPSPKLGVGVGYTPALAYADWEAM